MLNVKTPDEVFGIIRDNFHPYLKCESIALADASGRILAEDITSDEFIPNFNRSAMDGYAVRASDTFGCSESIPAILDLQGSILMGEEAQEQLKPHSCFAVPTGGAVPDGSDAVVMIENTEDFGDGTIGILSPVAPGKNYVFKGDDLKPGDIILHKGRKLSPADIGSLASMGMDTVNVFSRITVGVISTGDEIIPFTETPQPGQIRNVNASVLLSIVKETGATGKDFGIMKDDEALITETIMKAVSECDMVLISGGSSAGEKDNTAKIINEKGTLLLHGIAIKPGKPTIMGIIDDKPVIGMPGHPGANFFIASYFVKPLIRKLLGESEESKTSKPAVLSEAIDSNHGRAELLGVKLYEKEGKLFAKPVISKSGLITSLAELDAYIFIPRDCEGLAKGSIVEVYDVF